jgi:hypothetical protein
LTYTELATELKTLGYPVAYNTFEERQSPPFLTIIFTSNNDLMADNINYAARNNFQVELYTVKKYPPTEKEVEDKFKELKLAYEKYETYLNKEELYQIVYRITLI